MNRPDHALPIDDEVRIESSSNHSGEMIDRSEGSPESALESSEPTRASRTTGAWRHRLRWWILLVVSLVYMGAAGAALVEPGLNGSSSTLSTLLAFVVLLGVFHLFFIWVFPFSRRDWKRVDYIWLGFAALGVVSVVGEGRRLQAAYTQEDAGFGAKYAFEQLRDEVKSDMAYFCLEQWRPLPGEVADDPVRREFPLTCAWFREIAARLPDSLGVERPQVLISPVPAIPAVTDEIVLQDLRDAFRLLDDYEREQARFRVAADAGRESDLEITFKLTGGFLLVFALALRVTKVTGELRSESGK